MKKAAEELKQLNLRLSNLSSLEATQSRLILRQQLIVNTETKLIKKVFGAECHGISTIYQMEKAINGEDQEAKRKWAELKIHLRLDQKLD